MHDMREGPMILIYFIFSSLSPAEEEDGPARAGIHASDDRVNGIGREGRFRDDAEIRVHLD